MVESEPAVFFSDSNFLKYNWMQSQIYKCVQVSVENT